jgi:uncharacterized protein (TIGR02246 family)
MKQSIQWVILTGLTLSVISAPGTASETETPLHKAAAQWIDYFEAADLAGLMTLYNEDVSVALHGQEKLEGKDAVRDYFASRIDQWDSRFELEFERVEMGEDRAWLMSKYWFVATIKDSGEQFRDAGRSLLVYDRSEEGQWLISADIDQLSPDVSWPAPSGME